MENQELEVLWSRCKLARKLADAAGRLVVMAYANHKKDEPYDEIDWLVKYANDKLDIAESLSQEYRKMSGTI